MTKITRQKIFEKLQLLDEYISHLKQLKKETTSKKKFLEDFHFYGLAERYLQLSCQTVIDTLQMLIIEMEMPKPESGEEIVSFLREKSVLSRELSSRLSGVVGFRNILVHEYGRIDRKRIYQYLMDRLDDFEIFKKEILRLIKISLV